MRDCAQWSLNFSWHQNETFWNGTQFFLESTKMNVSQDFCPLLANLYANNWVRNICSSFASLPFFWWKSIHFQFLKFFCYAHARPSKQQLLLADSIIRFRFFVFYFSRTLPCFKEWESKQVGPLSHKSSRSTWGWISQKGFKSKMNF